MGRVEGLPPQSETIQPVVDKNGKVLPGLFVFDVLHRDPAIEAKVKEYVLTEKQKRSKASTASLGS